MSEEPKDVKPKLNLHVAYEGTRITVKVKANTQFKKIFEAAEKRFNKEPGTFKFAYGNERLRPEETPAERGMEDEDVIDAYLEQVGGCRHLDFNAPLLRERLTALSERVKPKAC